MRFDVLLVVLALAAPASAFVDPTSFFVDPTTPHVATLGASTEGIYFTGAPRYSNLTCRSCHVDAPGQVRLRIGADDPSLFDVGYTPGKTYVVEVELQNEVAGLEWSSATCTEPGGVGKPYVQCNNNAFALEIDSGDVALTSGFCPTAPVAGKCAAADATHDQTVVAPGGDAVFANRAHDPADPRVVSRNGATDWTFHWTAPQAGSGPLTLHVAAVDGDGGLGTATMDQDPLGDDVVEAAIPLNEAGGQALPPVTSGCGFVRHGAGSSAAVLCVLLLLSCMFSCRRARTKRRAAR